VSARAHLHTPHGLGDRAADWMTSFVGSWRFLALQNGMLLFWFVWNSIPGLPHWDPQPFLMANIILSWEAANATSTVLMSQGRQSAIDRARDDHEADEVDQLFAINQQQLEILQELRDMRALVDTLSARLITKAA
jgi:uncharacterized membrane protein